MRRLIRHNLRLHGITAQAIQAHLPNMPFRAGYSIALSVKQPLDEFQGLELRVTIKAMPRSRVFWAQEGKLRFPEAQDVSFDAEYSRSFSDFQRTLGRV